MNDPVQLTMLRHDSPTGPTCPSLSHTSRRTFTVVGTKVTDPAMLAQMGIGDDETVVEIPDTLLPELIPDA